jgi:hypothetical protein
MFKNGLVSFLKISYVDEESVNVISEQLSGRFDDGKVSTDSECKIQIKP